MSFNHNPNTISEQNVNKSFTLCPIIVYENGIEAGGPGSAIAYALNSVKFDPATAGRCNDEGATPCPPRTTPSGCSPSRGRSLREVHDTARRRL